MGSDVARVVREVARVVRPHPIQPNTGSLRAASPKITKIWGLESNLREARMTKLESQPIRIRRFEDKSYEQRKKSVSTFEGSILEGSGFRFGVWRIFKGESVWFFPSCRRNARVRVYSLTSR